MLDLTNEYVRCSLHLTNRNPDLAYGAGLLFNISDKSRLGPHQNDRVMIRIILLFYWYFCGVNILLKRRQ